MSKALRMVTEELQAPPVPSLFSYWHPFYMDISGNGRSPPCYLEFVKLMECLEKQSECKQCYTNLAECIHKHGFSSQ